MSPRRGGISCSDGENLIEKGEAGGAEWAALWYFICTSQYDLGKVGFITYWNYPWIGSDGMRLRTSILESVI